MRAISVLIFSALATASAWGQTTGDYRSVASGNWSATSTWETWDGSSWVAASDVPNNSSVGVYLESGFTVTMDMDAGCNDLNLNTGSYPILITGSNTLSVYGKLRAYTGTAPGTNSSSPNSSKTWINTSDGGKIKIVGSSRAVTNTGEWGANPPCWTLEIALDAGAVGTTSTSIKAGMILVTSGTFQVSDDIRPDNGDANSGTLRISSGATLSIGGDISRTGTASAQCGLLDIAGTLQQTGTSSCTISAATINLNNSSGLTLSRSTAVNGSLVLASGSVAVAAGKKLTIGGTLIAGANSIGGAGNFTLSSGGTLTTANASGVNGSVQTSGTNTLSPGANYTFNGSSPQVTGTSMPATVNNIEINNSAGVTLSQSTTTASMTFTAGKISTGTNTLTVTSGSVTGAGSSSFVDGNIAYNEGSTGTHAFPTGEGSDYLPVVMSFTSLSGSGAVTVSAISQSMTPPAVSLGSNKVLDRYFHVANGSGITEFSADMTLSYADADLAAQGITDENSLRVFESDGMTWTEVHVAARDVDANTIDVSGVTSFSDFVISGTSDSPLPVVMGGVSAKVEEGKVILSFSTATETNIAGFDILRSNSQADQFEVLSSYATNAALKAKGCTTSGTSYSFTDTRVSAGHTYCYRVRAVETSGATAVISGVVEVSLKVPKEFALYQNYPNPFNPSTTIRYVLKEPSDVRIQVFDLLGRTVRSMSLHREAGTFETAIDMANMPSGVYYCRMTAAGKLGGDFVGTKKMVLMR